MTVVDSSICFSNYFYFLVSCLFLVSMSVLRAPNVIRCMYSTRILDGWRINEKLAEKVLLWAVCDGRLPCAYVISRRRLESPPVWLWSVLDTMRTQNVLWRRRRISRYVVEWISATSSLMHPRRQKKCLTRFANWIRIELFMESWSRRPFLVCLALEDLIDSHREWRCSFTGNLSHQGCWWMWQHQQRPVVQVGRLQTSRSRKRTRQWDSLLQCTLFLDISAHE